MKITRIVVLEIGAGADKVLLYTDVIEGAYPYKEPAVFSTDVARGAGEKWALENFRGHDVEVIRSARNV